MIDKIKSILLWVCYGFCGVGTTVLFIALCALICDGIFTLTLYMRMLGLGNGAVINVLICAMILGFFAGLIIRRLELTKQLKTYGSLYVDAHGNEYEIIKGVKDKDGMPYVIVMDYPKKNSATAYTLKHFNDLFKEKDA